jgi:beta-lactamase superfamily II metal-dependent hydrolase
MAILIEAPCAAVLIDAGGEKNESFDSDAVLQAYLDQFFSTHPSLNRSFEALIATHPHVDHTRGLSMVVHNYGVHHFYHDGQMVGSGGEQQKNAAEYLSSKHVPVTEVSNVHNESQFGQNIRCDGQEVKIRFLSGGWTSDPGEVGEIRDLNNHSIVTRIDFGKAALMFPGDLESAALDRLVGKYAAGGFLRADVLQVPHHGSKAGTTQSFLAAVAARIAVISVGRWDDTNMWSASQFGHPRSDVVEAISANVRGYRDKIQPVMVATGSGRFEPKLESKALYATGWDGNVVVTATDAGEISVQRQSRGGGILTASATVGVAVSQLSDALAARFGVAAVWPKVVAGTKEFTLRVATGPTSDVERWKKDRVGEQKGLESSQGALIVANASQEIRISVSGENLPHIRRKFPTDPDAVSIASLAEQFWFIAPGATDIETAIALRAKPRDASSAPSGTAEVQLSLPVKVNKLPISIFREAWDFFKGQAPWIGTGIAAFVAWLIGRFFKRPPVTDSPNTKPAKKQRPRTK